jgi:hypothetical protein
MTGTVDKVSPRGHPVLPDDEQSPLTARPRVLAIHPYAQGEGRAPRRWSLSESESLPESSASSILLSRRPAGRT